MLAGRASFELARRPPCGGDRLARAVALDPGQAAGARDDADLEPIRGLPGFPSLA